MITDNVTIANPIVVASGGKLILGHSSLGAFTINFTNNAKIIVEDGGTLLANSNVPITMTSAGTWGGIEFNGNNSHGNLFNITFQATTTPVVINGRVMAGPGGGSQTISLNYCTFTDAPVQINNRPDVSLYECDFNYPSANAPDVCGVAAVGANNLKVIWCTFSATSLLNKNAINVLQGDYATISKNTFTNISEGIVVSNNTPYIRFNTMTCNPSPGNVGVVLNNCVEGFIIYNTITGYTNGISLSNNSSPVLNLNTITNNYSNTGITGLYCDNNSNPRVTPTIGPGGEIYWDGGDNDILSNSAGDGINVQNSAPNIDYGYNTIFGLQCYLNGTYSGIIWDVRCNNWVDDPPLESKFCNVTVNKFPWNCTPPGSGSVSSEDEDKIIPPPPPIIVNYGNGNIDTFDVSTSNIQLNTDKQLYNSAVKKSLESNFPEAVNMFQQVIQNYQDSTSAIEALKKIFYCNVRMNSDTVAYNTLSNYYLGLASANSTDTTFAKTAEELVRKCLVKKNQLENAINQYENVIQTSNDSSDIIAAEINVIEIYMLMSSGGESRPYSGQLSYLRPMNMIDAMRMINDRLIKNRNSASITEIPKVFSLSQNYPNPFNPLTKINYALPNQVNVTLKVYDILGRLVKTLVNEFKVAGNYSVSFDGSGLASGVYFYKIEAGEFVQSRKMVLIK